MAATVRALVIDDDRLICQLLAEYLAPHGYEVSAAHTGPYGAAKAVSPEIDVVILDVMLPEMDGFEVLKRIRARSDVPVMMLTARNSVDDRVAALWRGFAEAQQWVLLEHELLHRFVDQRVHPAGTSKPNACRQRADTTMCLTNRHGST